jgi:hypothetical protein
MKELRCSQNFIATYFLIRPHIILLHGRRRTVFFLVMCLYIEFIIAMRLDAGIDISCEAKPPVQNSTYIEHIRGAIVGFSFLITKKCAIRSAFGHKMAALTVPISRQVYIVRHP